MSFIWLRSHRRRPIAPSWRVRIEDGRLLLTEDKDFGDLVFRRGGQVPGIVLLRINPAMHALKRLLP